MVMLLERKPFSELDDVAKRMREASLLEAVENNAYQYESLDETAKEIRLMTLLAGKIEDPIRIELTRTPFPADGASPSPAFEALSYVSGSESNPSHIHVESGQTQGLLSITQNLAQALLYLRHPERDRIFWIDAICVNQKDLEERSKQVQNMGDIYSHALRVVVWLGPEKDNSAHALELISSLATKVKIDWSRQQISAASVEFCEWADRTIPLPYEGEFWLAICKLLLRPWFDRLWVQQEVRLAKEVVITCGNSAVTWHSFCSVMFLIFAKADSEAFHLRADRSLIRQRIDVISGSVFYCNSAAAITFADLL